jgi:hypothetical protein
MFSWRSRLLRLSKKEGSMFDDVERGYWASVLFNGDLFLIQTRSGFRGGTNVDFKCVAHHLWPDASDEALGLAVLDAMSHSRWVLGIPRAGIVYPAAVEFDKDLHNLELSMGRYQQWIADLMTQNSYKTKRALFKNMHSCSVDKYKDGIKMRPSRHEKLEAWGSEKSDDIENVIIPADSTAAEIGAALKLAFTRCIPIYDWQAAFPDYV